MGLIGGLIAGFTGRAGGGEGGGAATIGALGGAVRGVAEVFTPSATRQMELGAEAQMAALGQHGAEFALVPMGWFDRMVNGLNRLPRPFLAFGTLGLFVYAMVDPESFGRRMVGLNQVPEPLWWLLGAVVGFYFGAREAHHFRLRQVGPPAAAAPARGPGQGPGTAPALPNPALEEWRAAA